ncbi:MAG: hypothetical protein JJ953_01415 [Gracilimonas sp.]|uniref:hypothetical protein n=1 Tax=Gracilimonas TaxID=649462 RepID=UPI001B0CFAAE|nr:hypothetical protein [Gracilimonas sp.]MBO6584742.1 hypothetical protein [Gracilimonas sp.]MBO6615987.1 hypothetical protein [Gracilimonas sp.]
MRYTSLLLLVISSLTLTGCFFNNDSTPVYREAEGVVLENGEAVANADIHIRNKFDPGGFSQEPAAPSYTINFSVQIEALYTLSLFRIGSDSVYNTFFEDTLGAGEHSILVPDSLLTNGILGYEVRSNFDMLTSSLFLVNKPDSLLPGSFPLTQTNANGEFTLDPEHLALGRSFTSIAGSFEVKDSLKIYVVQDSTIQAIKPVKFKPNQDNFFEIVVD